MVWCNKGAGLQAEVNNYFALFTYSCSDWIDVLGWQMAALENDESSTEKVNTKKGESAEMCTPAQSQGTDPFY